MCKSKESFSWGDEQVAAFAEIKHALCQAPILAHFVPSLETRLYTDASYVAVGSVLMQLHPEGEKVIAYSSKLLNKAQRNYTVTEIEFYSIICAVEKFYTFLIDLEFFVITDHRCIAALVKTSNAVGRIARWQIRISPFSFTVLYKPGKENTVADCLSRYPLENSKEPVQLPEATTVFFLPNFDIHQFQLDDNFFQTNNVNFAGRLRSPKISRQMSILRT